MDYIRDIEVEINLRSGQSFRGILPSNSPILGSLYNSLASSQQSHSDMPATLLQFPLEDGTKACSFMSSALESIVTKPPVLINHTEQEAQQQSIVTPMRQQPYVMIEDFLTPAENQQVLEYALENESNFEGSTVLTEDGRNKDPEHRRSRVLFAIQSSKWNELFSQRLKLHLTHIAPTLGLDAHRLVPKELQLTASNDGDFFKAHADSSDTNEDVAKRVLTFVYYFHKSTQSYSGGNLLFHRSYADSLQSQQSVPPIAVPPRNNCLVAFSSDTMHEVDIVRCPSGDFSDSRFTINGWLRYD